MLLQKKQQSGDQNNFHKWNLFKLYFQDTISYVATEFQIYVMLADISTG